MASPQDDSKEYQVPATDSKGHSVRKSFRVPPQVDMEMQIMLGAKKWPYRTEGEMLRHALVRHLRHLHAESPATESLMPQIEAMIHVVAVEQQQREFDEVLERVVSEATALGSAGHGKKARALVDRVLTHVEKMQDEYWRERYRRAIHTKLAHFLQGGR